VPSCSRLSRSGLEALRQTAPLACRPSLTPARHDGVGNVQAGTERCSRPNQKITPKRRTECGQTRYPDPKTSPVHETGASPSRAGGFRFRAPQSGLSVSLQFSSPSTVRNTSPVCGNNPCKLPCPRQIMTHTTFARRVGCGLTFHSHPSMGPLSCAWQLMIRSLVHGPAGSTSVYVKLLLPPRQSRGNSLIGLGQNAVFAPTRTWGSQFCCDAQYSLDRYDALLSSQGLGNETALQRRPRTT
jgi:hypothetical protein